MDSQPYAPWPTKQSPSPPSCSPPDKLSPPAQHTTPSTQTQTRRAVVRALLTTLACVAVGFSFGGLGLVALAPEPASGVSRALSRLGAVGAAGGRGQQQQHRVWKRQQAGGTAGQEYSTTTYADGAATSTFVKTTRPIVNPGGYTIGTLTGFVPAPTTTVPSATSPPAPSAAETATTTTTTTTSVTSAPSPPSTSDATSQSSQPQPPEEPSFTRSNPFVSDPDSASPATTMATATATALPTDAAHRLAKRRQSNATSTAPDSPGRQEYSTSTDTREGRETTVTLVKTTRPIVNAGGYTIGTLDGAWVDVAKQMDRPSPSPTRASAGHDELRRRNVVRLVEAGQADGSE